MAIDDLMMKRVRAQEPVETNPVRGRATSTPEFVFEKQDPGLDPEKIQRVVPMNVAMVEFTDSNGAKQIRVVFVVRGDKGGFQPYIMRMQAPPGTNLVVEPDDWFTKAFGSAYPAVLEKLGLHDSSV